MNHLLRLTRFNHKPPWISKGFVVFLHSQFASFPNLFKCSSTFGGQYGQYNDNVSMHYDSGPNSNLDYDQNIGQVQQNMNAFHPSHLEEATTSSLPGGRGRMTRSSRGRSECNF